MAAADTITYNNLVLYDGVCNFCNASVHFILTHESAPTLMFASLQSPLGKEILTRVGMRENYTDSILLIQGDQLYKSSVAAFRIAGFLHRPWRYIRLFRYLPIFFTNMVYDFIAAYRYNFWGKEKSCIVPAQEYRDRFLA